MNILYVEPYFADSHQQWIESYKKHSAHAVDILKLPGNKWKWRMHGGAITLAEMFNTSRKKYDLILCSDFLNLPVFKSLCLKKIKGTPIAIYFHENQLAYPWSKDDQDISLKRDLHYYYINQTSAMTSDWNYFNSNYNLESLKEGLKRYLKKMPDFQNIDTIDSISNKSSVLHLGCDLSKYNQHKKEYRNQKPVILWNHRWEYDKNPELFFNTLFKIKDMEIDFSLVILGEKFSSSPEIFKKAEKKLKDNIIHLGYCKSFKDYANWLWKSDIAPVTSNQDFFGISVVEASYCNVYPILPDRLSYRELFNKVKNPSIFYKNEKQLLKIIVDSIRNYENLDSYADMIKIYDWEMIVENYDQSFKNLVLRSKND